MRDIKTYLYHYLITIASYGKLRMLRKGITLGTHILWDIGQEGKGMGEGKMKGARGEEHCADEKCRWTGEGSAVCLGNWGRLVCLEHSVGEHQRMRPVGYSGWTGKCEGSHLSFYLFVADDFIEKLFPTFPCLTYQLRWHWNACSWNHIGHLDWKASKFFIFLLSSLFSKFPLEFSWEQ